MGECWTFLRRRDGHPSAVALLDRIDPLVERKRLVVQQVTEEQQVAAWESLRKLDDLAYSFVDATSFRAICDRRVREAFAFDGDFAAAGFIQARP